MLNPMGWDAFGLPAENAAIERNTLPDQWTWNNIRDMKNQMQALGLDIDWYCELSTCDENYYRHTQWIFTELFRRGLAY